MSASYKSPDRGRSRSQKNRRRDSERRHADGRPHAQRSQSRFDENGRIDSVYRPARSRSRYDRSSSRYTSANAENRREGRREVRSGRPSRYEQVSADATRYSRDHYVRRDGQSRSIPVSQQSYVAVNRQKPVKPQVLLALSVLAVALLAIIVVRLVAFGGSAGEYLSLRDSISTTQAQIQELEASDGEMQAQMDAWQQTIDIYNSSKK